MSDTTKIKGEKRFEIIIAWGVGGCILGFEVGVMMIEPVSYLIRAGDTAILGGVVLGAIVGVILGWRRPSPPLPPMKPAP